MWVIFQPRHSNGYCLNYLLWTCLPCFNGGEQYPVKAHQMGCCNVSYSFLAYFVYIVAKNWHACRISYKQFLFAWTDIHQWVILILKRTWKSDHSQATSESIFFSPWFLIRFMDVYSCWTSETMVSSGSESHTDDITCFTSLCLDLTEGFFFTQIHLTQHLSLPLYLPLQLSCTPLGWLLAICCSMSTSVTGHILQFPHCWNSFPTCPWNMNPVHLGFSLSVGK